MQRLLHKVTKQQVIVNNLQKINKLNKQTFKFSTQFEEEYFEEDLFNDAYSHKRNDDLHENSPIKHIANTEYDISRLQKLNSYFQNPTQYLQNEKQLLKTQLGENFDSYYNRGFEFQINNNNNQENLNIKVPLFVNEYGNSELTNNLQSLRQLDNLNYLQKDAIVKNIEHTVTKDEHFSFVLNNYKADEYVQNLQENQIILFNLPKDITQQSLQTEFQALGYGNVSQVEIKNNLVGLPAYAILNLESQEIALKARQELDQQQYIKDNLINIRHKNDTQQEHSLNRTLVVQGFSPLTSIQEILQVLSCYGSVMHLELVEENVNPSLPSKQEVIEFLNKNYKNQQFEIISVEGGLGKQSEIHSEVYGQNKQTTPIINTEGYQDIGDLKKAQNKQKQIKQNQIDAKLADNTPLYTLKWCDNLQTQNSNETQIKYIDSQPKQDMELVYEYLSEEQKNEIREKIQNQKEYQNLGYCFVTYASVDNAKQAYGAFASNKYTQYKEERPEELIQYSGNWDNISVYLKGNSDHYYYDSQHLLERFTDISNQYKKISNKMEPKNVDQKSLELQIQQQKDIKQQIINENTGLSVSQDIRSTLSNELLSNKTHSFEFKAPLDENSIGRDFTTKTTKQDIEDFRQDLKKDHSRKQREYLQYEQIDNQNLENQYKDSLQSIGIENLVDPLNQLTKQQQKQLYEKLSQEQKEQEIQQLEESKLEQLKIDQFNDQSKGMLRAVKRKHERQQISKRKNVDKKTRKEQKLNDDSSAEFSVYNKNQKHNQYNQFVNDLKTMITGNFEKELSEQLFQKNQTSVIPCRDIQGNFFYDTYEADRLYQYQLSKEENVRKEQLQKRNKFYEMLNMLPEAQRDKLENCNYISQQKSTIISQEIGIPIESYDISLPEGQSIEEYVQELNQFAAESGEEYVISENVDNQQIIVKVLKQIKTPEIKNLMQQIQENKQKQDSEKLQSVQFTEIQQEMVDTFIQMGLTKQDAENETVHFFKHQDYSENIQKLMDSELNQISDEQISQSSEELNMSRQQIEIVMNMNNEFNQQEAIKNIKGQQNMQDLQKLHGEITKQDIIRNQTPRVKDEKGQYITSRYNQI